MAIENRDLQVGTRLVARYKKQEHWATVVEGEKGGLRYRLDDGREFKSPSAACSAVMGGVACNGWRFWSVAGSEEAKPKQRERRGKKANPGANLIPLEDGRWFCSTCQEAFPVQAGFEPEECPKGHKQGEG
ncbi:MAG: hypothetical protein WBF66_12695, partial [Dehalococcoidia bacterium]